MAKYGKKAQETVSEKLHEQKHEHRFNSRKQAIAVGLSQARKAGGKVPPRHDR